MAKRKTFDVNGNIVEPKIKKTLLEEDSGIETPTKSGKSDFLDLTTWKRCKINDIQYDSQVNALIIQGYEDVNSSGSRVKPMLCHLQSIWANSKIHVGDIVSIIGVWIDEHNAYCVTLREGFCVIRPDVLVPGTTVVNGMFCMRKAIFADRFKGIGGAIKTITIGKIVRQLFQLVLQQRLTTLDQIQAASKKLLTDENMAYTLYSINMSSAEARQEFNGFLKNIHGFMQRYIEGNERSAGHYQPKNKKVDEFKGKIDEICDIEDNIWLPKLGLKGIIDVSVKTSNDQLPTIHSHHLPMELKTGKASFSAEHAGQLVMYQMIMSEIEQKPIKSGLLVYLRDGIMREIGGTHTERRDLIILRNEISYFLSRQHEVYDEIDNYHEIEDYATKFMKISTIPDLPEPTNRFNACQQCPYNVMCSIYLGKNIEMMSELGEKHPLKEIGPKCTNHLTEKHIEYFCHWVGLMTLEDQKDRQVNPIKSIWLESIECRQMNGDAITNLILNPNLIPENVDGYIYEFISNDKDLVLLNWTIGSYLIVSISKRFGLASGRLVSIEGNSIKLMLKRTLSNRYNNEIFTIDRHESQTNTTFNMSNLGALLDDIESSEFLRNMIIDRKKPTFNKSVPEVIIKTDILDSLNSDQLNAVIKALTVNEYLLIKGLPGTGKTQTLAALIRLLVLEEKSVLVTGNTHSAVDNVLVRLMESDPNLKFLRLGCSKRISTGLKEHSEEFYRRNCKTADDLAMIYGQFNVVGVTCLGSGHPLLTQRKFDVCLVVESMQLLQSTVLRPLFSAKKFILVGDPDQSLPIVRSSMAKQLGAEESLFVRLDSPTATATLSHQYRMNKTITKLANDLTYFGVLKCANVDVATATIKQKAKSQLKWVNRSLSSHIDQSVMVLNTANVFERNQKFIDLMKSSNKSQRPPLTMRTKKSQIHMNYCEAAIILQIIKDLKVMGVKSKMIGVIAPYASQVDLLNKCMEQLFDSDIEIGMIDQYLGRDKEIIIYSCTQSKNINLDISTNDEILEDQRRLTLAITRAKHKFIMIGDMTTLTSYEPIKRLLDNLNEMSKINLIDQQQAFDWKHLLYLIVPLPERKRKKAGVGKGRNKRYSIMPQTSKIYF